MAGNPGTGASRLGLCSVTLRHLGLPDVVDAAVGAGIDGVEWGSDVHVPDPDAARRAAALCADAGLRVMSLGSYYRARQGEDCAEALAIAQALGAPRIRVWAGVAGSAETTVEERERIVGRLRRTAAQATDLGIRVAVEFHNGTLTDTADSAVRLLEEVDHDGLGLYWQPPLDLPVDRALESLAAVRDSGGLAGVHCFSWWPAAHRLPLKARADLWTAVVDGLRNTDQDFMLEFVRDDTVGRLAEDATWLADILARYDNTSLPRNRP